MLLQLSSSLTITDILVQRQAADMWSRTVLRLTPSQHFTAKYSGRHTRASSSCEMVEVVKREENHDPRRNRGHRRSGINSGTAHP